MNIVSYRGPGVPGGVSSALTQVWEANADQTDWWHLVDNAVKVADGGSAQTTTLCEMAPNVVQGHYRFCNNFLWPVLHDLPQFAVYREEDALCYQKFNAIFSRSITRTQTSHSNARFFVQDYQLALMPKLLRKQAGLHSTLFWHVPWPSKVEKRHVEVLSQLAQGMLSADTIGFHVEEYGDNFLQFVSRYLPEFYCDDLNRQIRSARAAVLGFVPSKSYGRADSEDFAWNGSHNHFTSIVAAPLGLNYDYWHSIANDANLALLAPSLMRHPYVLSVDRADYTKGITQRLESIDAFFTKRPEYRGKITFAQICGRTRNGIDAYDRYWAECRALSEYLINKWSSGTWQPIVWLDMPFSARLLSLFYRNAAAMLVNPIRDGLNLTAKEYVACQGANPGTLLLSKGAGTWQELGRYSLEVRPDDPLQMADAVYRALNLHPSEKALRIEKQSQAIQANSLENWWQHFATLCAFERDTQKTSAKQLQEIS